MQSLTDSHGVELTMAALRHLIIRLDSRPDTSDLSPAIRQALDALKAKSNTAQNATDQRIAQSAVVQYEDAVIDRLVRQLRYQLLAQVNGDAKDPRYVRLIPQSVSKSTAGVGNAKQTHFVTAIVQLIADNDDYKNLRALGKQLAHAQKALTEALEHRDELYVAEHVAVGERRIAMDAAKRAYNMMRPRLELLFPDDAALVDSFFRHLHRNTKAPEEPSAPAVPPDPTV